MSLEAFRAWAEQYGNFMRQNRKAFEEQGLETARTYLTEAIDSKLSTRLKTSLRSLRPQPLERSSSIWRVFKWRPNPCGSKGLTILKRFKA